MLNWGKGAGLGLEQIQTDRIGGLVYVSPGPSQGWMYVENTRGTLEKSLLDQQREKEDGVLRISFYNVRVMCCIYYMFTELIWG